MNKTFELGDVLSVTTGRLVSRKHMGGIYEIMGFLTGDEYITTLGLLAMKDTCTEALLAQHPQLHNVVTPDEFTDEDHIWSWLAEQERLFGETLEVEPIDGGVLVPSDLTMMRHLRPDMDVSDVIIAVVD